MTVSKKIRIVIADDHPVVRDGLCALLTATNDFEVVAQAENGNQAFEYYKQLKPDLVLLDLAMPNGDGIMALKSILGEFPDAKVVMLTMYAGEVDISNAFKYGAKAYILKNSMPQEIINTLKLVQEGQKKIPPHIQKSISSEISRLDLTEREYDVIKLMAKGMSNEEIAKFLNISLRTTKGHVTSIISKLQAENRTQAVIIAIEKGIIHI